MRDGIAAADAMTFPFVRRIIHYKKFFTIGVVANWLYSGNFKIFNVLRRYYLSEGTDGAIWLLEAAINDRYKIVERTGYIYPKHTKCLSYLISLTDMNIPKDKIY